MDITAIRVFTFSILPLLLAGAHLALDRRSRSRERRLEVVLLYLFGIGIAASGLSGFLGHVFVSDLVAESIGWPTGNPFQLEVGVASLAGGVLGLVAMGRRDGFREATVVVVAVLGTGATVVHFIDFIESANLAPGNTIQNVGNVLKPALLILFLVASRRAERLLESRASAPGFESWRGPRIQAASWMAAGVAAGFGVGFAFNLPLIGTLAGTLIAAAVAAHSLHRSGDLSSPSDRSRRRSSSERAAADIQP